MLMLPLLMMTMMMMMVVIRFICYIMVMKLVMK